MAKHGSKRFHRAVISGVVAVVLFLALMFALAPFVELRDNMRAVVSPAVLTWFVNEERERAQLLALTPNMLLREAAQRKAEDMARFGYFEHTSPEGLTPWYWLEQVGYTYDYAGENLALDFVDSGAVTKAWMQSNTHRSNLLKGEFTEIGTGVATSTFEGFPVQYVVQLYARPQ